MTHPIGLNYVADLDCDQGLCEAARLTLDAVRTAEIPYHLIPYSLHETKEVKAATQHPYPITMLYYNINIMQRLNKMKFEEITGRKYSIAFWFWELPSVPEQYQVQLERLDEVWVAARYVQNALLQVTNKPVHVVPLPIHVELPQTFGRADYDIPADRYTFLFSFSAASGFSRKNPWGVIDAYKRAFGYGNQKNAPLLIIKTNSTSSFPKAAEKLRAAVAKVGGILIEDSYTRTQVNGLMACTDAYISLHRAEGFGLTLAEAMYLGKPVIGTHYSAPVDFMNYRNSYPVRLYLRQITHEDHIDQPGYEHFYEPGRIWAEPDIDHAAEYMHYLYENQEAGREQGKRAASSIRTHLNNELIGRIIKDRLGQTDLERRYVPRRRLQKVQREIVFDFQREVPGYGWHSVEVIGAGINKYHFQWMAGQISTIEVTGIATDESISIEFTVDSRIYPGSLPEITLQVNDMAVALNLTSKNGLKIYTGVISKSIAKLKDGRLHLDFKAAQTFIPRHINPKTNDTRVLGVPFRHVILRSNTNNIRP